MSWLEATIGDFYKVASSKRVLKSDWKSDGIPFYRGREITSLSKYGFVENDLYITEKMYEEFNKNYGVPVAGDIMVTAIGTIGNTYIVRSRDKFYFKDASVLWLKKKKDIDSNFVNYWFKSSHFTNQLDVGLGATVDTLTIGKVQSLKIHIPSLSTQQKIVSKLDAIFAELEKATASAEANAKNAETLFQSYLTQVFEDKTDTFKDKRFDEICTLQRGFDLPTQDRKQGEYKLLSANGVTDYISEWKVQGPGVVTGRSGTIGKVHYVDSNFWALNTSLYVKNFFGNDMKYLYYFLTHFKLERFVSGAGVPTLNRNVMSPIIVSIESDFQKQKKSVEKLDDVLTKTESMKRIYFKKVNEFSFMKQSILKQAFAGELVKE